MTVDDLILKLQILRASSDEIGQLPVASIHPDSGWSHSSIELVEIVEEGEDICFGARHVRLAVRPY